MRHWGTSRKVAGSIPDCGPGVESASERNECQQYFLGGKDGRCVGLITLSSKSGSLDLLEPSGPVKACTEITYIQEVTKDPTLLTAAVPSQAWSGPEGSRKLNFPDFTTTAQVDGKVVSLTHRPPITPGNTPGTHFC